MKKLLIGLTLLTSMSSFAGTISCETTTNISDADRSTTLVSDALSGTCINEESGERYLVEIGGLGLTLRENRTEFKVSCPFKDNLEGTYIGAKMDVSLKKGANAGIYVGKGVCMLGGIQDGYGAGITGSVMEIIKD